MIEKIERNIFGHLKYLPRLFRFNVQKNNLITVVNCELGSPMFNIVFDSHLEQWAKWQQDSEIRTTDDRSKKYKSFFSLFFPFFFTSASSYYGKKFISNYIDKVILSFKEQPFYWLIGPSCDPKWLKSILLEKGLTLKKTQQCLLYDPRKDTISDDSLIKLNVKRVEDEETLQDFITIIQTKDPNFRKFYEKLVFPTSHINEKLFVGYDQNEPAIAGVMYVESEAVGIYNLWCKVNTDDCEEYRINMARYLVRYAQLKNYNRISLLTSNSVEHHIYELIGFREIGFFECLEWKGGKPSS